MTPALPPVGEDDINAFIDDRLTPERRAIVEAMLRENPDLAARVETDRALRDAMRSRLAAKGAEPVPARLRIGAIRTGRRDRWRWPGMAAAAAVLLAVGAAGGYAGRGALSPAVTAPTTQVAQDSVSAWRIYTVEVAHPVEVGASEQAHLLKWLSKRLGRPLTAPNLSQYGYRLIGGRLLPAGEAAAALLMYDTEGGARLTVYVRAGEGGETAFRYRSEGDLSTFAWLDQGFGFAVSAALPREKLQPIVDAVYREFEMR